MVSHLTSFLGGKKNIADTKKRNKESMYQIHFHSDPNYREVEDSVKTDLSGLKYEI